MDIRNSRILSEIAAVEADYEREISLLRLQVEEWRTKYFELLNGNIKHNEQMYGLVLKAALGADLSDAGIQS